MDMYGVQNTVSNSLWSPLCLPAPFDGRCVIRSIRWKGCLIDSFALLQTLFALYETVTVSELMVVDLADGSDLLLYYPQE